MELLTPSKGFNAQRRSREGLHEIRGGPKEEVWRRFGRPEEVQKGGAEESSEESLIRALRIQRRSRSRALEENQMRFRGGPELS